MKHFFFSLLLLLQIPMIATAAEAYAVYTNDGTLTFYYDNSKSSRSGTKYAMNTGYNEPGWYTDHRQDIKKVVFTSSFANARPKSTYQWFSVKASEKAESALSDIVGIQYLNTSEVTNMGWMFAYCTKLQELDVSHFNTAKVTNISGMFCDCSSLTTLDVSNFNTNKVTSMSAMFEGCSSLTSLNVSNFDTSNVTNFWYMFKDCSALKSINVSNFNTSKVTDFCAMFDGCSSLTTIDVSHFNTSNATRLNSMFSDCSSLTSLDLSSFNTSKVTGMGHMFNGCKSLKNLNLSNFNSTNVTTMSGMFDYCSSLTSLDLSHLDTRNVTEMGWMFNGCTGLKSLDLSTFNTSKVTEMKYMFDGCTSLTTIYAGNNWSTNKVSDSRYMFRGCTSLVGGAGTKYNASHVDKAYAHIDGGVSNPGYLTDKNATPALNLQEFINANAGATGVVDVDLSKFQNDLVREQTLTVSTGASYRFINGSLDRAANNSNPVMLISQGSKVEIGDGAVVTGRGNYANGCETIRMEGGTLNITQGVVEGALGYPANYIGNPWQTNAVLLNSANDHFILTNGELYGTLSCNANGADIQLKGGQMRGFGLRAVTDDASQQSPRRATPMGSRSPSIITYSDIHLKATTSEDYTWGYNIILPGGSTEVDNLCPFHITLHEQNVMYLQQSYEKGFEFTLFDKHEGDVVAVGENYNITQTDVDKMTAEVYYSAGSPYTDDRKPYLELKNNKVYLRYKTEKICDADDAQRWIDNLTSDEPTEMVLCDEPTIDDDVEVDDAQIWIDGTDNDPQIVIMFIGGAINIHQNASMSFKAVTFADKDAAVAALLRAADGNGGIRNSGALVFENCTFREGSYTIENSGATSVDGGNAGCRLVNKAGGRVNVTRPLTDDLTVIIPTEADVEQGIAIVTGVSSADHILMSLPAGYAYKYDATAGGIVVYSTTGITALEQQKTVVESYDVTGRKASQNGKGLHIQRMSDGTIRKSF